MARAAGDSPFYRFGIVNRDNQITGQVAELYSVTTILKAIGKPLTWWGYKLGILALREAYVALEEENSDSLMLASDDELYETIKQRKVITPNVVRDKAGSRGTTIHDVVETYFVHNKLPDPATVDAELHPYIKAFVTWTQDFLSDSTDHRVVLVERPVYSLRHQYAGTCDLIIFKDGVYYIVDIKTSKALYSDTLLQPIAYMHAAMEMSERARHMGKPKIAYLPMPAACQPMVVALHDDETYESANSNEFGLTIDDFLSVMEMFLLTERLEVVRKEITDRRRQQVSASN